MEYPLIGNSLKILKEHFLYEYDFLPVCEEVELNSFEQKFNVIIPEVYRWFLLNIGNGIIHKENNWLNIVNQVKFGDYFYKDFEFNPSLPFEYKARTIFGLEDYELDEDDLKDYPYETVTSKRHFKYNGSIFLGGGDFLVVNGSEYGNVWDADIASNGHIYPQYDQENGKERLKFDEWFYLIVKRYLKLKTDRIARKKEEEANQRYRETYQKQMKIEDAKRKRELSIMRRRAKYGNIRFRVQNILMWIWFILVFLVILLKVMKELLE